MRSTARTPDYSCLLYPNGQVVIAVAPGEADIESLRISKGGIVSILESGAAKPIARLPRLALKSALAHGVIVIDTATKTVFSRRLSGRAT